MNIAVAMIRRQGHMLGLCAFLVMAMGGVDVAAQSPARAASSQGAINLITSDGVALFGAYLPGRSGGPAVVLLHQNGRDHEEWSFLADTLQRGGYHVLAIDLRGHGKSLQKGDKPLNAQKFGSEDYRAMTNDVAAAVVWLRSRPEVDGDRVAIIGASLGANLALSYAAGDPRIDHVAMLSPGLDYKGVATEEAIQRYGERSLFIAVSREDNYSAKSALVLDASSPKADKEMKIFTGAGHGTRMLNREPALETALLTWLNQPSGTSATTVGGPPSVPTRDGPSEVSGP